MNNDFLPNLRGSLQNTSLGNTMVGRGSSQTSRQNNAIMQALQAMTTAKDSAPVQIQSSQPKRDSGITGYEIIEEVRPPEISIWDLSSDVIRGKYGNGKERQDALNKAGYNYHQVQDFVNKRLNNTLTNDDFNRDFIMTEVTAAPTNPSVAPDSPGINDKTTTGGGYNKEMVAETDASLQAGAATINAFLAALRNMSSPSYVPSVPKTGVRSR